MFSSRKIKENENWEEEKKKEGIKFVKKDKKKDMLEMRKSL